MGRLRCVVALTPRSSLPAGTSTSGPHNADSRNFKAGLNFFFNKNLNHLNLESR